MESDYGAGRVIQLVYGPVAERIASDQALRSVAWDQALARVVDRWGGRISPTPAPPQPVGEDQIWASTANEAKVLQDAESLRPGPRP